MTRSSKGFRRGTRSKLKRPLRSKFKPNMFITDFRPGDRVIIRQESISQHGMPHPRFRSVMGEVLEKRGSAYMVRVRVGKTPKQLTVSGEHLKPAKQ